MIRVTRQGTKVPTDNCKNWQPNQEISTFIALHVKSSDLLIRNVYAQYQA